MATNAEIDSLASGLTAVADAKNLLGRASELVHEGYGELGDVTWAAGAREEARSSLNLVNDRLTQVYLDLPDAGSQTLTEFERRRVAGAVLYARDTLRTIDDVKGSVFAELLDETAAGFRKVISFSTTSLWKLAIPIAVVVVALLVLRRSA